MSENHSQNNAEHADDPAVVCEFTEFTLGAYVFKHIDGNDSGHERDGRAHKVRRNTAPVNAAFESVDKVQQQRTDNRGQ